MVVYHLKKFLIGGDNGKRGSASGQQAAVRGAGATNTGERGHDHDRCGLALQRGRRLCREAANGPDAMVGRLHPRAAEGGVGRGAPVWSPFLFAVITDAA